MRDPRARPQARPCAQQLAARCRRLLSRRRAGSIDFNEFLELLVTKMSERDSKEDVRKAFRQFDHEGTGKISFDNLKRVARELGENMTDEEIMEMIHAADLDKNSLIDPDEFWTVLKRGLPASSAPGGKS